MTFKANIILVSLTTFNDVIFNFSDVVKIAFFELKYQLMVKDLSFGINIQRSSGPKRFIKIFAILLTRLTNQKDSRIVTKKKVEWAFWVFFYKITNHDILYHTR